MLFDEYGIIKKMQKNLVCPICQKHFAKDEIKLKGMFDNTAMIHTECRNNHPAIQSLHIVMLEKVYNEKNINKQINDFDGDFIKLWKK